MTGDEDPSDEVEYVPEDDQYVAEFDPDVVQPSVAVVKALAGVRHTDPTELDPLYETLDTDAFDALIERPVPSEVAVSFEVDGFEVTVSNGGTIFVETPD